ncbi:RagB/SusD family nutrient uptake outer membrane protein [Bacteroides sp.]|uniref:RagB/SusD family nutrient uptake outer membrane protein n=1 Tax=Bacteroides sp. TaxID=29523 RepID=UPI0025C172CA|nr:RagB/SusD family nutrient uptake outer membrane protein [Bacteroides sp.]
MKNKYISLAIGCVMGLGLSGCSDLFLDLDPQDQRTDVIYFQKASDFKDYSASFYSQLLGWRTPYGSYSIYNYMDSSSDLSSNFLASSDLGRGTIVVPTNDDRWDKCYNYIRTVNILLKKAETYPGEQSEIAQYVSEAYFFRAYNYFMLLKTFGGIPIVKTVLDTDSPELMNPRASRYDVIDLILSDLSESIKNLPLEQNIPSSDKGRVSVMAAKAFKARVLLYEATWRKYNGTSTDFKGSEGPEKDQINEFLDEAITLCQDVIYNGGYQIWNYNSNTKIPNQSSYFLFNLEDEGSNPAGLTKASNNEFILYGVYDYVLRQGGTNLSHTVASMIPSRKLIDMFLCQDGLPIEYSEQFEGYHKTGDEYKNRDFRLMNYTNQGVIPEEGSVVLDRGLAGYNCSKFYSHNYPAYRKEKEESANYPVLRLAEVFLNYAEACYERNGEVTNEQLSGINQLRARGGVEPLTNEFIEECKANGYAMDMLSEIRRERAIELFMEGFRFDDLKRWGIAEQELNQSRLGMVVGGDGYETEFKSADGIVNTSMYKTGTFPWGEEKVQTGDGELSCVVISSKSNHSFAKKHYLWPIPQKQRDLNPNLVQNPGY